MTRALIVGFPNVADRWTEHLAAEGVEVAGVVAPPQGNREIPADATAVLLFNDQATAAQSNYFPGAAGKRGIPCYRVSSKFSHARQHLQRAGLLTGKPLPKPAPTPPPEPFNPVLRATDVAPAAVPPAANEVPQPMPQPQQTNGATSHTTLPPQIVAANAARMRASERRRVRAREILTGDPYRPVEDVQEALRHEMGAGIDTVEMLRIRREVCEAKGVPVSAGSGLPVLPSGKTIKRYQNGHPGRGGNPKPAPKSEIPAAVALLREAMAREGVIEVKVTAEKTTMTRMTVEEVEE